MNLIFKIYQVVILIPFVVLMTIWAGSTMAVMCPITGWLKAISPFSLGIMTRPDWWGSFATRWWGRLIIRMSLIPVDVKGSEHFQKNKSYVFTANHQGFYDVLLVCGYLNAEIRWMMKRSLEKVPFLGIGCRHAGYIFVDRGNAGKVRATYRRAEEALKGGASVMVFPEGSRCKDGHIGAFRRGAFTLADELQLSVVPMTINGSYDVMPRGSFLINYHPLSLTIHPVIDPVSQGAENIEHLKEESFKAISSALV